MVLQVGKVLLGIFETGEGGRVYPILLKKNDLLTLIPAFAWPK